MTGSTGVRGRRVGVVVLGAATACGLVAGPASAWPRSEVDGGRVGRTIDRVLLDPAFAASQETWLSRLRDNIRQWLLERLADVFDSGAGPLLAWALLGLAVVVGVLVIVRATRGLRAGAVADGGPDAVVITRRPPDDWLADARDARDAGDLAEAIRCGYRAVVAGLAHVGALEEVPGRTVGEYRQQVGERQPDRLDAFGRASEVFERVWYARRPATEPDVDVVLATAADAVGGPTRAGATA